MLKENGLFVNFLLNISWISTSYPNEYTPFKIKPVFYNNLSDLGGEGLSGVPLPDATEYPIRI